MEKVALIQKRLVTTQSHQKNYVDCRRKPLSFEVGDYVFLKISRRRDLMRFRKSGKLSPMFIRPFEILELIGEVAYHLVLPPYLSRAHDVFHIYIQDQVLRGKTIPLVKLLQKHHGVKEAASKCEAKVCEKYLDLFVDV
ncbi:uncharacterized protein LOC114272302 [Camellia sinensis]|uniref:uncharacterized protein LOC114272302 n=1 Tax=Camellia sinensis TaxID=4442 RepID=UPI001036DE58|nr:uncharacterized protein LOC114272302 [Camellia sinensis]